MPGTPSPQLGNSSSKKVVVVLVRKAQPCSQRWMLCRGSLGQRDTGRGCERHGHAPSYAETTAGLGRAQALHSGHPHGSGQPPVWTQHQGCLVAKLQFKHAGKHLTTLRIGTSVTCLSHKAWETELCFEVCSASFKELEKVFESRTGEDETLLTSSSHLPSALKPELTTKPSPTYSYSHYSVCQGLTPNIL